MNKSLSALFFAFGFIAFAHAGAADVPAQSKMATESVSVTGEVEHKLSLTVDDLKKFPVQQIDNVKLTRQSGASVGKPISLKGVLLRDILEKASVLAQDHNDVKKTVIVAIASDGYKVVFSWSELFNSPLGAGVLVFFERDGQPLGDDEGRIAMISSMDTHTGPRHVKWLQSIDVRKIVD